MKAIFGNFKESNEAANKCHFWILCSVNFVATFSVSLRRAAVTWTPSPSLTGSLTSARTSLRWAGGPGRGRGTRGGRAPASSDPWTASGSSAPPLRCLIATCWYGGFTVVCGRVPRDTICHYLIMKVLILVLCNANCGTMLSGNRNLFKMKSHPAVFVSVSVSFTIFGMSKTCCHSLWPEGRNQRQRHHTTQFYLCLHS